jgi:hypothetical protein
MVGIDPLQNTAWQQLHERSGTPANCSLRAARIEEKAAASRPRHPHAPLFQLLAEMCLHPPTPPPNPRRKATHTFRHSRQL